MNLTDFEWRVIEPLLPNKPRGMPRVDDRRTLNGIFWVLRSGAPWRDLPARPDCFNERNRGHAAARTKRSSGLLASSTFAGLAEFERELIKTRTGEGRIRAKARGVKFGRKSVLTAEQRAYVAKLRAEGESVRQIARVMGVSTATIGRIAPAP